MTVRALAMQLIISSKACRYFSSFACSSVVRRRALSVRINDCRRDELRNSADAGTASFGDRGHWHGLEGRRDGTSPPVPVAVADDGIDHAAATSEGVGVSGGCRFCVDQP